MRFIFLILLSVVLFSCASLPGDDRNSREPASAGKDFNARGLEGKFLKVTEVKINKFKKDGNEFYLNCTQDEASDSSKTYGGFRVSDDFSWFALSDSNECMLQNRASFNGIVFSLNSSNNGLSLILARVEHGGSKLFSHGALINVSIKMDPNYHVMLDTNCRQYEKAWYRLGGGSVVCIDPRTKSYIKFDY